MFKLTSLLTLLFFVSCSSFKAERVDAEGADKKAMKITDEWVRGDTERAVKRVLSQMKKHKGYLRYMARYHGQPKVFVANIQNKTAEAYFPVDDMTDEFLYEISAEGDFILVDKGAREAILEEIKYQNDGMVDPMTAKKIGKQIGADLMIFGAVYMKPSTRSGKTIKDYSVNIRMTDIEKAVEVLRTRAKISKYSEQASSGW